MKLFGVLVLVWLHMSGTANARDFSAEVEDLFRRGKTDSALASSQAFVVAHPDSSEAHGYLGTMYTEIGRLDDALAAFNRVTELDPGKMDGYRNLALLQAKLGKVEAAIQTLTIGLGKTSNAAELLLERGLVRGNAVQFTEAVADFEQAIKQAPRDLEGYHNLALMLTATGDFDGALAVLDRGLNVAPGNARILVNKGGVLHSKGDISGAFKTYRSAIDATPEDSQVHRAFGFMAAEVGSLEVAEAAWSETVRLNPRDLEVRNALGQVYVNKGDGKRALDQYEEIVKSEPRAAIARHTLGFLYRSKGDLEAAKREFRACIQIEPEWTEPYKSLAVLHVEEGHLDSSLAIYNAALRVDATDVSIHNNVGYVYSISRNWPDAKKAYQNAVKFSRDPEMLREVQKNLSIIESVEAGKAQVRHIVVRTRAKAEELLSLLNAGSDFAELAKEHSVDGSGPDGGNLGFFDKGDLHPDFESVAFGLEIGGVSSVFETPVGFHIMQRIN